MTQTTRVALVTGAARGIGAAIAERLALDGCDVAVMDLKTDTCTGTVQRIEALGRRAVAVAVDVADEASVQAGVEAAEAALGPPAVLVNNAGVLREKTLARMTLDDWQLVQDVNLRGAFLMCRAVQSTMRREGHGRIVNLASIAALGAYGQANYAAAKAGLIGLTKTIALELGKSGVTANVVAPGFVVTPMTSAVADRLGVTFEAMIADVVRDIPAGRPGQPEDIANAVSFFADPRSGFVSGQVLYVAGGPRG
jgi:3-oxoacyl-[acyl-carrier protein] reductase